VKADNRAEAVCMCRYIISNKRMPETDPNHSPEELRAQGSALDE
jgi:hypothetical protein